MLHPPPWYVYRVSADILGSKSGSCRNPLVGAKGNHLGLFPSGTERGRLSDLWGLCQLWSSSALSKTQPGLLIQRHLEPFLPLLSFMISHLYFYVSIVLCANFSHGTCNSLLWILFIVCLLHKTVSSLKTGRKSVCPPLCPQGPAQADTPHTGHPKPVIVTFNSQ